MKPGYVYMMSNEKRTKLYIGVTNNLKRRVNEHKMLEKGYTARYLLTDLVYFERIGGFNNCIKRETQLKNWRKEWKWDLVRKMNPELIDLYSLIC